MASSFDPPAAPARGQLVTSHREPLAFLVSLASLQDGGPVMGDMSMLIDDYDDWRSYIDTENFRLQSYRYVYNIHINTYHMS